MPTYDYACSTCGHRMEVLHSVLAHGPRICPNCGGPMHKLFAAPAIHFKGSGWAKKDRGGVHRSGHKSTTSTDGDGGSGEGSGSGGSSGSPEGGEGSGGSGAPPSSTSTTAAAGSSSGSDSD